MPAKPSISKHLGILENAGLISSQKQGAFIRYSLVQDNLSNTLIGFAQQVCPVSRLLRAESQRVAAARQGGKATDPEA